MATSNLSAFGVVIPPNQSGYQYKPGSQLIIQQLEGGGPRVRLDQVGANHYVTCRISCTQGQYTWLMGFFREFMQGSSRAFRMDLIIDTALPVNHLVTLLEEPSLVEQEGLLYVVDCKLSVFRNPMKSFTFQLDNNTGTPTIVDIGTLFYGADMSEFPVGRAVQITGSKQIVEGVEIDLDSKSYSIVSAPNGFSRTLGGAGASLPGWTALAGTVAKAYHPTFGAAILLPI